MESKVSDYVTVARTGDIAPGQVKVYEVSGRRIALCNVDGALYAIDDVCTHDGGPLDQGHLEGDQIECPRHGARFDIRTGAVRLLPAVVPIPVYPLRIEGDEIQVKSEPK